MTCNFTTGRKIFQPGFKLGILLTETADALPTEKSQINLEDLNLIGDSVWSEMNQLNRINHRQ